MPKSTPSSDTAEKESGAGVAAVDRAFAILRAVEAAAEPISLSELSRVTGLYKSTILRLLVSLEKSALVIQRPDLKYTLGPFAYRLGRAYDDSHHLRERVLETLDRLVGQGTESASFHVRYDDHQRLCLFRVDSKHSTLDNVKTGDLLPLERGAPAKVINTWFTHPGSPAAAVVPAVLSSFGERNPSCAALSCPVFSAMGQFIGALSLSGPLERYSEANIAHMSPLLIAAARALTESLGGRWPSA